MQVEGQDVFVKDVRVNHARSFTWIAPTTVAQAAWFDFEGTVTVTVTVNDTNIGNALVRPLAHGVVPQVAGNVITFQLTHHGPFVLEYIRAGESRAYRNALHIFTNAPEQNPVDPNNLPADYLYIGPGVWYAGAISLSSNETLYIAGGAVVYGYVRFGDVDNVTVRGRGIISGEIFHRRSDPEFTLPIEFQRSSNVTIQDISIIDPAGWAITVMDSEDVEINNVNIITARANGDGISVQSARRVAVTGGFVRAWDDALVVKNAVEADRDGNTGTEDITFDNVVVWVDLAQAMEIGFEAHGPYIRDVYFRNITVLYAHHLSPISINNADKAAVSNINFINITIENAWMMPQGGQHGGFFINIRTVFNNDWSTSDFRGPVSNITIENIQVLNMRQGLSSIMTGETATASISNVAISDISIAGRRINSLEQLAFNFGPHVDVATVTYQNTARARITGATLALPYTNEVPDNDVPYIDITPGRVQGGVEVPDFAMTGAPEPFLGHPMSIPSMTANAHRHFGTGVNPGLATPLPTTRPDTFLWTSDFEQAGYEANNLLDGDPNTSWRSQAFSGEQADEFVALRFFFDTADSNGIFTNNSTMQSPGVARIRLPEHINYVFEFDIQVRVGFQQAAGGGELIGRDWQVVNSRGRQRFTSSPARGNIIDVPLTPNPVWMIQLQFFVIPGSMFQPEYFEFAQVEFLPPPLSLGADVISSHGHFDVWEESFITNGNFTQYFESAQIGESWVLIDLGQVHDIRVISLHLPPSMLWQTRVQDITIEASTWVGDINNVPEDSFDTLVARDYYVFDPALGNVNMLTYGDDFVSGTPTQARFIRIWLHSNFYYGQTVARFGGQLSAVVVL